MSFFRKKPDPAFEVMHLGFGALMLIVAREVTPDQWARIMARWCIWQDSKGVARYGTMTYEEAKGMIEVMTTSPDPANLCLR